MSRENPFERTGEYTVLQIIPAPSGLALLYLGDTPQACFIDPNVACLALIETGAERCIVPVGLSDGCIEPVVNGSAGENYVGCYSLQGARALLDDHLARGAEEVRRRE